MVCYGVLHVTGHVVFCYGAYSRLWWITVTYMGHRKARITKGPFADAHVEMYTVPI